MPKSEGSRLTAIEEKIMNLYKAVLLEYHIDIPTDLESIVECYPNDYELPEEGTTLFGPFIDICNGCKIRLRRFSIPKDIIKYCIINGIAQSVTGIYTIDEIESTDTVEYTIETVTQNLHTEINTIFGKKEKLIRYLSSSKYEKRICRGNVAYLNVSQEVFFSIDQSDRISFHKKNIRIIRKMMEITSGDFALCFDSQGIIKGIVSLLEFNGIVAKIKGPNHYEVYDNNELIAEFRTDKYYYKKDYDIIKNDEENIKKVLDDEKHTSAVIRFCKDIMNYNNSFHGAMLVFTNDEEFVENMANNHRAIRPDYSLNTSPLNIFDLYKQDPLGTHHNMQKSLLRQLCKIDGAVVFDLNGDLLLFGTILDGLSKTEGKRERGSRYNSAQTFVDYYKNEKPQKKYLAITISEDGNEYGESPLDVFV